MNDTLCFVSFDERFRKSLVSLYKEIWKEPPWNESFWTDKMVNEDIDYAKNQGDFIGKLATNSMNVVGFTWGYRLPLDKFPFLDFKNSIYVDELAVRKDFRKKGIGTRLTEMIIEDARRLGYDNVALRTDVNGSAYLFYTDRNFKDTGIRDPEYPERTYRRRKIY
jgi:ribosomal protein S18 acetylase RimI-like enzyme